MPPIAAVLNPNTESAAVACGCDRFAVALHTGGLPMITPRTATLITVALVTLLLIGHVASSPRAQTLQLPPIFAPGQRVVSPLGEILTVRAVEGEWIAIDPPQFSSGLGGSGGALTSGDRWLHVPTGSIWRSTPGLR